MSLSSRSSSITSRESVLPDRSTISSGIPLRSLDEIRDQVAAEIATTAVTKSEIVDGVRIGVTLTLSKSDDEDFLKRVAHKLTEEVMALHHHVFAFATTGPSNRSDPKLNTVVVCGYPELYVQRAALLASAKFLGRMQIAYNTGSLWIAPVKNIAVSASDEAALWDVLRKAARTPRDPLLPPAGCRSASAILADARARLQRLPPTAAYEELLAPVVGAPTFLVDIRSNETRTRDGGIHGSLPIDRNVLEWRFDPRSRDRLLIVDRYDLRVILFCEDGKASSLAAVALQDIGLLDATDIIGGYAAWKAAGLPVVEDKNGDEIEQEVLSETGRVPSDPSVIHILD